MSLSRKLAIIGGVFIVLGALMPWSNIMGLGGIDLTISTEDLSTASLIAAAAGVALVVLGIVVEPKPGHRLYLPGLAGALIAAAAAIYSAVDLASAFAELGSLGYSDITWSPGTGLYVTAVGVVIAAVGAMLPLKRSAVREVQ